MVKKLFFIATLLYIGATVSAENYLVKSPDGKIVAELNTNKSLSSI
jgi:alpha-glucosidase